VVDIRRGEVHRPPVADTDERKDEKRAAEVERWLAGEAAAFSAIWGIPA
jgi:hypothetical protein